MINAFRSVGSYVELFEGERPLLKALADGRLQRIAKAMKVVYNGIEGGIAWDGFEPGRKALIPAVADSYGLICSNSNAYACALGRHKFHYFTVLRALGVRTPRTWHYRPSRGWAGGQEPTREVKVIAKSTYESWSVGVTDKSIFVVDKSCEERVAMIADQIGQPVTVQEFVSGTEVCVPVISCPERLVPPPLETILAKAPGDMDAVTTIHDNLLDEGVIHRRYEGSPEIMGELLQSAARAFDVLELQAFARIDFRIDEDGRPWVTDVGVSPSVSAEDSAFHSIAELGFDYPSFLRIVIAATLASRDRLSNSPARTRSPAS
jgi:D-alanine-D-alanine ligase